MEQRDFLKDQIEQAGKVLAKIIGDFMGLKHTGDITPDIAKTNGQLDSELDIDIDKMAGLDAAALREYVETRQLTDARLEQLATYLHHSGREDYAQTALRLLDIVDDRSGNFSLTLMDLRNRIGQLIVPKK